MINSKIFKILSTFSSKECKALYFKLNTTASKKDLDQMKLLKYLIDGIKTPDKLSKKEAYISCFESSPYNDSKMRIMMFELLKKIEVEITYQNVANAEHLQQIALLNHYEKHNLYSLFDQDWKKFSNAIEKSPLRDEAYYEHQFEMEQLKYDHDSKIQRTSGSNMQAILDKIDIVFISKKLRQSCYAIGQEKIFQRKFDYGLLNSIIEFIKANDFNHIPCISMYFHCYNMLLHETDESFEIFKNYLFSHSEQFSNDELRNIYMLAINHCIKWLNSGKLEYGRQGLELYKASLKSGILLINNYLSRYTYTNITTMAMRVKEYDWAEQFVYEYRDAIKREERDNVFYYNLAFLHFNKKELDEAMEALLQTRIKDPLLNLAGKCLQMKIYYEMGEENVLFSHLDAMQIYLVRNKVIGYHKQLYFNLIKYTKRLMRIKLAVTISKKVRLERIEKAKELVRKENLISERVWFLEQLDRLA